MINVGELSYACMGININYYHYAVIMCTTFKAEKLQRLKNSATTVTSSEDKIKMLVR